MTVGENIRSKRTLKGMKQIELARLVGVSQAMIAQIERGTKTVTVPLALDIAQILGCSIGELVGETKQVNAS